VNTPDIHPTAFVHPDARLGANTRVGAFSQIHAGVILGGNSQVGSYCELGYANGLEKTSTLEIGANSLIRSHSVFYLGSRFGPGLSTGHRVTIRENTQAGKDVRIGTLSDIQGDCQIGEHCRLHSNVHVGKHSQIDRFAWIFPYVVLTNDPTPPSEIRLGVHVGEYAVVATMSVLLPGVSIGPHALVGAGSVVRRDVSPHSLVAGNPARFIRPVKEIRHPHTGAPMYPWPRHFHHGYPDSVRAQWQTEFGAQDTPPKSSP